MTRRATTLLALVCAVTLAVPAVAGAASGGTPSQAITDCNDHGQLTAHYSPSTLQAALGQMPVDVREYTDCYDVIERQLLAELGKTGTVSATTAPASSGGSFLPTWLIVVIVVLALAAVTFGALAIRRRGDTGGPGSGPGTGGPGGSGTGGPGGPGSGGPGGPGSGGPGGPGSGGPGAGGPPPAT